MSDETMVVQAGRQDRSPTLGALAKAKAQAQAKFLPLGKGKTANAGKYSYDYADLAACLDAVIPALSEFSIALFQPVQIIDAQAVATTLLVHESNEFISGDFAVAIVDPRDAQSVGSATTYARRYGLLAMLGYAAGDEDDDGEAARGGNQEQKPPAGAPACPACGVIGSLMKGAAQYGGGVLCWAKRGGCGVKWPEGTPFPPTSAPPLDPEPGPTSSKRGAKKEPAKPVKPSAAAEESGALIAGAPPEAIAAVVTAIAPPPIGSEDCETEGCWGGHGHPGAHVFEDTAAALKTPPAAPDPAPGPTSGAVVEGPQTFTVGNAVIETAGMTEAQFVESLRLATAIDKGPLGEGYSRGLLAKMLHVPVEQASRKNLTQALGEKYLEALRQAATAGTSQ